MFILMCAEKYLQNLWGCFPTKDMHIPPPTPSEVVIFIWKMHNVLKRMKNNFSHFYFLSYGHFLHKNVNFLWIFTITRKKKMLSRYTNRSVYNCPEWDRTIEQYKSIQIWLSLNRRTDYVILEKAASAVTAAKHTHRNCDWAATVYYGYSSCKFGIHAYNTISPSM